MQSDQIDPRPLWQRQRDTLQAEQAPRAPLTVTYKLNIDMTPLTETIEMLHRVIAELNALLAEYPAHE